MWSGKNEIYSKKVKGPNFFQSFQNSLLPSFKVVCIREQSKGVCAPMSSPSVYSGSDLHIKINPNQDPYHKGNGSHLGESFQEGEILCHRSIEGKEDDDE